MAKVRYATYCALLNVPATDSLSASLDGLLRDILPDEPFKVHGFAVTLLNSMGTGDDCSMILSKNVVAAVPEVADTIAVKHGVLATLSQRQTQAAGVSTGVNVVEMFPEPLDFDRDDSLNMLVVGTNTDAAVQTCRVRLVLLYEVG